MRKRIAKFLLVRFSTQSSISPRRHIKIPRLPRCRHLLSPRLSTLARLAKRLNLRRLQETNPIQRLHRGKSSLSAPTKHRPLSAATAFWQPRAVSRPASVLVSESGLKKRRRRIAFESSLPNATFSYAPLLRKKRSNGLAHCRRSSIGSGRQILKSPRKQTRSKVLPFHSKAFT